MKQVITTPNASVEIDYDASQIKGRAALIYLTNANIPNVSFSVNNQEDAFDLVSNYIMHKSIVNIECLVNSIRQVLYVARGVTLTDADQEALNNTSLITPDQVADFLSNPQRAENTLHLIQVLDNIPTFLVANNTQFKETHGDAVTNFDVVDAIDYVGYTFINLIRTDEFIINYFSVPPTAPIAYFKQQFDEYAYGGKNLFAYLSDTFVFPLLNSIAAGNTTEKELESMAA
jgi:hypothetical protein